MLVKLLMVPDAEAYTRSVCSRLRGSPMPLEVIGNSAPVRRLRNRGLGTLDSPPVANITRASHRSPVLSVRPFRASSASGRQRRSQGPAGQLGEFGSRRHSNERLRKRPKATARALAGGWLTLAHRVHGCRTLLLRCRPDLIIRGGENISPREIEEVLYRHPAVGEPAVVGQPDPVYGQKVAAFVTLKADAGRAETESVLRQNLARFKVPEHFSFLADLPNNSVGKILESELKKGA